MLRSLVVLLGLLVLQLSLFCGCAAAEQWQTVVGREKFLTVSVDLDSLQTRQQDDIVFFKLRADDHDDTIATRYVQASCSEFSLEVDRESIFHPSSLSQEHLDWKNNLTLANHPQYAQARLSFWGITQAYGQAIALACRRAGNHAPERLHLLQAENCNPSNPLRKVACSHYASWRANYKLYFSRSHDVIHNCGISEERMTKQAAWLLKSVMHCKTESCGNEILENWIHKRGQDIASVIHMQKNSSTDWSAASQTVPICQSLNLADQEIASMQTEELYAKAKYLGCVKRENARLRSIHAADENIPQQAEQLCDTPFKEWHEAVSRQSASQE